MFGPEPSLVGLQMDRCHTASMFTSVEKSGKIIKATIQFMLLVEKGQISWKEACGGCLAQNFHT